MEESAPSPQTNNQNIRPSGLAQNPISPKLPAIPNSQARKTTGLGFAM